MELKIDTSKVYAIALEGGGAKGCYEVGIWKALEEAGVRYNAVSGSSVGALNGAMMASRELQRAIDLWENIKYSQIMDVDDALMEKLFSKDVTPAEVLEITKSMKTVIKDGGFDISPLRRLLSEIVDEDVIRNSDVDLYVMTYSLSDRKELDIDMKQVEQGKICDMLLASAYLPGFKNEKLDGKRYTDGSVQDILPIHSLLTRGYKDIILMRVYGIGVERRVKIPKDVNVITIAPNYKLGHILDFNPERSKHEITLGYFDAKRVLYGLQGSLYYLERTMTEKEAYRCLASVFERKMRKKQDTISLREMNEEILPKVAKELGIKTDYYDVFIAYLEKTANELEIPEFEIMTERELFERVKMEAKRRKTILVS